MELCCCYAVVCSPSHAPQEIFYAAYVQLDTSWVKMCGRWITHSPTTLNRSSLSPYISIQTTDEENQVQSMVYNPIFTEDRGPRIEPSFVWGVNTEFAVSVFELILADCRFYEENRTGIRTETCKTPNDPFL